MALFDWDDRYSVNISNFDQQHKQLVQMINELYRALLSSKPRDVLGDILDRMITYAGVHFHDEEVLMSKYNFPWLLTHREEHEAFVNRVLEYQARFEEGSLTMSTEIVNFLKEWLKKHIMGKDKDYSSFLREKGVV
jgi:hemerythrin